MSVNEVHDILMDIRQETFRHPSLTDSETVEELKDRLEGIRQLIDFHINQIKNIESFN